MNRIQERMPLLFVGHGSPMNAIENNAWTRTRKQLGERLPRPKAILCLSAHFTTQGTYAQASEHPPIIHDFYGFPQPLFDMQYPAPGSPDLARGAQALLEDAGLTTQWGIDHGAWSVLTHMYPQADIPVVQLSLDLSLSPGEQMAIGQRLAPLREEGVLILSSGNVVHNLRRINPSMAQPFAWANAFDDAIYAIMQSGRYGDLTHYAALPGATDSVPTTEHFVPLLYAAGAAREGEKAQAFCRDYYFGSLSMTGYLIGAQGPAAAEFSRP